MSTSHELTIGDIRTAMHQVMPDVPGFATRPASGELSPIEKRPTVIRDQLIDAINADGTKVERPTTLRDEIALSKLESYTILGSCGLALYPHMIERPDEGETRFLPDVERLENINAVYDLAGAIRPIFHYGYGKLERDQPWVSRIEPRLSEAHMAFKKLTRKQITGASLRGLLDGGAIGPTIDGLTRLACKLEQHQPGYAESLDQRLEDRFTLIKNLAYLGVSSASVNLGLLGVSKPLSSLEGTVETVTKNGQTNTHLKRESRDNMRAVFPASLADWLEKPMEGPTLKCPFQQLSPVEGDGKSTVVTEAMDATLTFVHERPERFLMTSLERSVQIFSQYKFPGSN